MNATPSTNSRLMAILIAILIVLLLVLAVIIMVLIKLTNGGMMGMGGMMMGGNAPLVTGSNGERIFKTGINVQGEAIQNSMMPGMGGCAMCHGADGHGGQMMGRTIPCNTFKCLTADGYTDALIKRAVTQGVAEDGQPLDLMMPRWQMSDNDLNDLISYLKTLP